MTAFFIALAVALLSSGCTTTVRIQAPSVERPFDGLPDPAQLASDGAPYYVGHNQLHVAGKSILARATAKA